MARPPPNRPTIPRPMPPQIKHPVKIAAEYIAELRARVESVGVLAVAEATGLARGTIWRQLTDGDGRRPSPDGIERIRLAVAKLDPKGPPMPPPLVAVRGRVHHAWIALADDVAPDDLARAVDDPALIVSAKRRPRRK